MRRYIKALLARVPFLYDLAYAGIRAFRNIRRDLGFIDRPKMLDGELAFFRAIRDDIEVLVDVGARFDVDYLALSRGRGISYYLFEANPKFAQKLVENAAPFADERVTIENVAVGERGDLVDYYKDSESLLKSSTAVRNSTQRLGRKIPMRRLDDYLAERGVGRIDFLKSDIEEYDYFALVGCGALLPEIRYLQFELGIGAPFAGRRIANEDYFALLEPHFDLYVCRDENNPWWKVGRTKASLVVLDDDAKREIRQAQSSGIGFNIVGLNRDGPGVPPALSVERLTQAPVGQAIAASEQTQQREPD